MKQQLLKYDFSATESGMRLKEPLANSYDLMRMIEQGEGDTIEFKKSTNEIPKDIYDTVCSFANRYGGHILLGVGDDGEVIGVAEPAISKIKKDFVTSINNENKMYPSMYLKIEEFVIEGKKVLYIFVPENRQVCRHHGRIFDRNNDSDLDVTDSMDLVYQIYVRKSNENYVDRVTKFGIEDLRPDLIERARKMAYGCGCEHPWKHMTDEELLRSTGLILTDKETKQEGVTIAGILLFGKDSAIMSALPYYKIDAIFRVENVDRYDDRDVIITNLLESYDRLMEFGRKHLSDPFVLEGIYRVSTRDKILRELFSNLLAHCNYSSRYAAKFIIEKDKMYTENASVSHESGPLKLSCFTPVSKNPAISKVFRELSLADELGSGMRNTYKYTRMYSGGEPEFIEGDIFRTIIPLNEVSVGIVGPKTAACNGIENTSPYGVPKNQ